MQPVYPYIAVEKVEDNDSSLVQTIHEKPVVKVIGIPFVPADQEPLNFKEENNILVNGVDEYMVKGEKLFFVRIKDIVAII